MQTCGSGFCRCVRNTLGSYSYILVIGCFGNQSFILEWVRVWVGDWGLPREKKRSYLEGFLSGLMVVTGIEFIGFLDV